MNRCICSKTEIYQEDPNAPRYLDPVASCTKRVILVRLSSQTLAATLSAMAAFGDFMLGCSKDVSLAVERGVNQCVSHLARRKATCVVSLLSNASETRSYV
jgi:hypothetical protein